MGPKLSCGVGVLAALALAACDTTVREIAGTAVPECTRCHGGTENDTGAPPVGRSPETIGAHTAHVVEGPYARAFGCAECHPDPRQTSGSHMDGAVEIAFGALATDAGTLTSTAYAGGGGRCSDVYCHGATLSGTAPSWTQGPTGATCGACHAIPPLTHGGFTDCGMCHPGYTSTSVNRATHVNGRPDVTGATCTACHGDDTRTGEDPAIAAMPPRGTHGEMASTDPAVGAHLAHMTAGPLARAFSCTDCHAVPTSTSHSNGAVDFAWSGLARGTGAPSYDDVQHTCASTYCHGSFTWGTVSGNAANDPSWIVSTTGACGTCHGVPPAAPHVQNPECGRCHVGYAATAVNFADHVDGVPDVKALTCTSCHGQDGGNAAPPIDTAGRSATTLVSVGAHQAHVAPSLRARIECTECHGAAAASYGTGHSDGAVQTSFGSLANQGTATIWNPDQATCATSYCHGGASAVWGALDPLPVWTTVTGRYRACTSCHGDPPPLAAASGQYHPQNTSCSACHGAGFDAANVVSSQHVNGVVTLPQRTGTCNRCHGSLDGYSGPYAKAIAAPGTAASTRSLAVGAHQRHVNPSAGAYASPISCTECHGADKTGASDHADGGALPLWTYSTVAKARGMTPVYDASSGACSTTYCHGKYSAFPFGGATTPAPTWATGGKLWCDACHGDPPTLQTDMVTPHTSVTACSACHSGYPDKGADSRPRAIAGWRLSSHVDGNVQVTGPTGGADCSICHADLVLAMRSTSSGYHHLLSNSGADVGAWGDKYPGAELGGPADPQRRCLLCHLDHEFIGNGFGRASNLRTDYSSNILVSGAENATDFDVSGGGLCISCHHRGQAKSYDQGDGTTQTPAIAGGATAQEAATNFAASAHRFEATSTFGDGSTFRASCSKCHVDTMAKSKQTSASRFGLHDSTVRSILDPVGVGDPPEEALCTSCHSGGIARTDRYGVAPMSQASARFDPFLVLTTAGTMTVAAGAAAVTGNGTGWYWAGAGTATFTIGSATVAGSGTSWTGDLVGRSVRNAGASSARWYTIVRVESATSLVISPAYAESTVAGAGWATSIASWSIRCAADTSGRWYSIVDVTSATDLTIYPAYGGPPCANSAYVAVPSAGHPMQLSTGDHRAVEGGSANWNGGASRHVTCADCHDPHEARPGNHAIGSGAVAGPNAGAWGVVATWGPSRTVSGVTLTYASRTVQGPFVVGDAGKNMIGPDRLVYPIAAANATSATIGNTFGYKGATTGAGAATVTIEDPNTPTAFALAPRLTSSDLQYQLCIKCHSAYGAPTPPKTAFFDAAGAGTTQAQTDLADEINPNQLAYHPIAAVGRNQPPGDANPSWATSLGLKQGAPNTGLDNTFVDGWGAGSLVACSDCHGSDSTDDPWGPHGSANQWLLKGIDPAVKVTLASGTITYPNACYYRGSTSVVRGVPDTGDSKNFCLNCHRADVYGLVTPAGVADGYSCSEIVPTQRVTPIAYANLSRVNHPVDNKAHSNAVNQGALTRFGIACMQCHGGGSIGAIHGTNDTDPGPGGSYRAKRLLVGATWIGVTRATTNAVSGTVKCWTKNAVDAVNTCTVGHANTGGNAANYDYDSDRD
jgi:predicted CxxxxCH...CXXCH cytochrome family protein